MGLIISPLVKKNLFSMKDGKTKIVLECVKSTNTREAFVCECVMNVAVSIEAKQINYVTKIDISMFLVKR